MNRRTIKQWQARKYLGGVRRRLRIAMATPPRWAENLPRYQKQWIENLHNEIRYRK